MSIAATYTNATTFTATYDAAGQKDLRGQCAVGVRIRANCGVDGTKYGVVTSVSYADPVTTMVMAGDALTPNLVSFDHGNSCPDALANHGHTGPADGGSVAHGALSGSGSTTHAALDAFVASKGLGSGLASLDASLLVIQNPANATAAPAAGKIPVADTSGKLDAWITSADTTAPGLAQLATLTESQAGSVTTKAVTPAGLAASAKGLVSANTTINVATTGSDTTGDGSAAKPYASIAKALASISGKLIASGVMVTIQVANGTYNIPSTIVIDHPDAAKIQILGNTSAETTVPIAAIDTAAKTITVAGDHTGSLQAGDIFALTGSGTNGLNGAYLASAVNSSGGDTIITCAAETIASATIGGGSVVIKPCNRCVLSLSSGTACFNIKTAISNLSGFAIVSAGGAVAAISAITFGILNSMTNIICYGWNWGLYIAGGSVAYAYSLVFKNCVTGIAVLQSAILTMNALAVFDACSGAGIVANKGGYGLLSSTLIVSRNCTIMYSPAINTVGNGNSYLNVA